MGLLDNFERGLERAVNGVFAKTFKSGLAPIEITSALRRELDTKAAVVSRERILVPNKFDVRLGRTDYQRMTAIGPTLIDELTQLVQNHATAQGYQFAGGISIRLTEDTGLSEGMIRVALSTTNTPQARTVQRTVDRPRGFASGLLGWGFIISILMFRQLCAKEDQECESFTMLERTVSSSSTELLDSREMK